MNNKDTNGGGCNHYSNCENYSNCNTCANYSDGKKKKKKKSVLLRIGVCALILFVVFGSIALIMGAASENNWLGVSEKMRVANGYYATPIEKTITLPAKDVTKLMINVSGEKTTVKYSDKEGDEITVHYFEDFENQKVAWLSDGNSTFNLKKQYKKVFFYVGVGVWDKNNVEITLPKGLAFTASDIKVSGGKIDMTSVVFGKTDIRVSGGVVSVAQGKTAALSTKISGGSLQLNGCAVEGNLTGSLSGGSFSMDKGSINGSFTHSISGGSVNVKNITKIDDVDVKVSGGSANFEKFPHKADQIAFDISRSGGSVYFNDNKMQEGKSGASSPACTVKVKVSGGNVRIKT